MRVVILTASTMKKTLDGSVFSGKCITALNLEYNRIIRFVDNRLGAPVGNPYCNNFSPLNVYDINVTEHCPLLCQTENALVDYRNAKFVGRFSEGIDSLYERIQRIKYNDYSFMLDGSYKLDDISAFRHSLEMVKVSNLVIEGNKCSFTYRNRKFKYVSVTDPEYKAKIETIGEAYLLISIPIDNYEEKGYFKFVAAVYPIEQHQWTKEEDEDLLYEYNKGWSRKLMSDVHRRSEEEICKRLSILLERNSG